MLCVFSIRLLCEATCGWGGSGSGGGGGGTQPKLHSRVACEAAPVPIF